MNIEQHGSYVFICDGTTFNQLAMCAIDPQTALLYKIFKEKYLEAVERQTAKGSDAIWYQINYGSEEA